MFTIPQGYDCVVRQSDTQLYGYRGNSRDTFIPNGLSWQKTTIQLNTNIPSNAVCLIDSYAIPSSFSSMMLLSGVIVVLCFFKLILNMFMGVRR